MDSGLDRYGPLELEIKAKKARVRVAREKINEADRQRPEEVRWLVLSLTSEMSHAHALFPLHQLQVADLEANKNETGRMVREVSRRPTCGRRELTSRLHCTQIGRVLDSVGVDGIPYLRFVTNPHSFAQTVENVFYLSFLVRENKCCIEMEDKPDSPFCGDLIVCELHTGYHQTPES